MKTSSIGIGSVTIINLVCAILVGAVSASGAEATYKLFGREIGGYESTEDLPGRVQKDLGPRASIVDWNEIKKQYGASEADLKSFCDKLGLPVNGSAWVTVNGKRIWQDGRHYFIFRADHKPPEDFLSHDQLQNNFLLLGSWFETRPVLVKITDYNAADAAKWAKWDEMLANRNKAALTKCKEIAGSYTLVTVNGNKVPTKVNHEGRNLEIRSGTFVIEPSGQCGSRMTFVPPSGTEASVNTTATYTLAGRNLDTLKMQWQGAGVTTGTIETNTFTMDNEGMVFVYRK